MDVLENNVIGAFIFGLGREIEAQHGRMVCEPIGVELLQQTPLDTTLGDVLLANARIVRLIEFKREVNKGKKEKAKLQLLKSALNFPSCVHLVPISKKVHWFVLTNFDRAQNSTVVPYLNMDAPYDGLDLAAFTREITNDIHGPGMSQEEFRDLKLYISILAPYAGSSTTSGTVGGLLFAVNADGNAEYIFIDDVRELAMTPKIVLQRYAARQAIIKAEVAKLELEAKRLTPRMSPGFGD